MLLPYHCLHHLFPPGPHFTDKLKDVEVISLFQSLHHCIKSDESASMTHTSTGPYREMTTEVTTINRRENARITGWSPNRDESFGLRIKIEFLSILAIVQL